MFVTCMIVMNCTALYFGGKIHGVLSMQMSMGIIWNEVLRELARATVIACAGLSIEGGRRKPRCQGQTEPAASGYRQSLLNLWFHEHRTIVNRWRLTHSF